MCAGAGGKGQKLLDKKSAKFDSYGVLFLRRFSPTELKKLGCLNEDKLSVKFVVTV